MAKVILQPAGNKNGREHYFETITNPVRLSEIKKFLSSSDISELDSLYPDGTCPIWGVTPGKREVNIPKWNRIDRGDITLFSKDGGIFASGVTTYKLHNRELAIELWGINSEGQTWEYIYFLDEKLNLNIDYATFNRIVGYQEKNVIQGFDVLDEGKSWRILNAFELLSDTYIEDISDDTYDRILQNLNALEETEREVLSQRRVEQSFLKKVLFGRKTIYKCGLCGDRLPIRFLVTAHIKRRAHCTIEEKKNKFIVFPACKFGCDELYESGYISILNGEVVSLKKNPSTSHLDRKLERIIGMKCEYFNQHTAPFFEWHYAFHNA